jgi:tripartite-type tricarboxylate transporter receptor subunit TctC
LLSAKKNEREEDMKSLAAALLACIALQTIPATAEDWPSKPIRMMVGFGAGGGTDVATRIVAEPLGDVLGQRVVVENKPGAGGTIAGDLVAKGTKDGYNALMISTGHTVAAAMIKAQNYDAVKDFAPVGIIANSAIAIVVQKDFPANDLKGLIEVIKKDPDKYNYATVGVGSTQHLTAELFRQRAGLQAQAVSFRTTGEVVTALLRKDVAFAVDLAHAVKGAGRLRRAQADRARDRQTLSLDAERADHDRVRHAGLRGEWLVRHGLSGRRAEGGHRQDPQGADAGVVARQRQEAA